MSSQPLKRAYLEQMMDEPGSPLESFLDRVGRGELGPRSADEVATFLTELQQDTVASMRAQAEAHPDLSAEVEERIDEALADFAELRRRYAPQGGVKP